jgi:hypothetical protein
MQQNPQLVPVGTQEQHIFATKVVTTSFGLTEQLVSIRSIDATRNQCNQFGQAICGFFADSQVELICISAHFHSNVLRHSFAGLRPQATTGLPLLNGLLQTARDLPV